MTWLRSSARAAYEPRDLELRPSVKHMQGGPAGFKRLPQFAHAVPDEGDAAVGPGFERTEDFGVEYKSAVHLGVRAERRMQCRMVEIPKVAAEPDQRRIGGQLRRRKYLWTGGHPSIV